MDLPKKVIISEEGPREGFQIEKGPIATSDKIALIDALSHCGFGLIQAASFVSGAVLPVDGGFLAGRALIASGAR